MEAHSVFGACVADTGKGTSASFLLIGKPPEQNVVILVIFGGLSATSG